MRIADDVLDVLGRAVTDGPRLLLPAQLDRALYTRVNTALEVVGGTWSRRVRAHLFPGNAAAAIASLLQTGEITTCRDLGYFPTPPQVVARLLAYADITPDLEVLEPSAGRGAIAGPLAARARAVDCVEIDPANAQVLEEAGYARSVTVGDFLTLTPARRYPRVVMNPPFAKQADIAHVQHALGFLENGGRLVAVMSQSTLYRKIKAACAFRDRVTARGGRTEALPPDAFAPSGTNVQTIVVIIPAG